MPREDAENFREEAARMQHIQAVQSEQNEKKILVLHTGTISMSADNDGKVSQNADNPMNHVGLDLDNLELTVLDFLNIPSPHITPYHMLDI